MIASTRTRLAVVRTRNCSTLLIKKAATAMKAPGGQSKLPACVTSYWDFAGESGC